MQQVTYVKDDADLPLGQANNSTVVHQQKGVELIRDTTLSVGDADGLSIFNIGGEVWRKLGNRNGVILPEQIGLEQGIDVTTQLQDFSDALDIGILDTDTSNQTLMLPFCEGTGENAMLLSDTVTFTASNWHIVGRGERSSQIKWVGAAGKDMLLLQSARAVRLDNFFLEGNPSVSNRPRSGVNLYRVPTTGSAPMRGVCNDLRVGGTSFDMFDHCVMFSAADGSDGNNEQWHFNNCLMQAALENCYWFGHQNSLWHKVFGGTCELFGGSAFNQLDIYDDGSGPVAPFAGGAAFISGVSCNGNSGAVLFKAGGSQHQTTIIGCDGEGDTKLLVTEDTDPPGLAGAKMTFYGGSYKIANQSAGNPQIDCAGNNGAIDFVGTFLSAGNGVAFKVDGPNMVLNVTEVSGNPNAFEATNGGIVAIDAFTIAQSGFTNVATNGGIIRYRGPDRFDARVVIADGSLDCSDADFVQADPQFPLKTITSERIEIGEQISIYFTAAGSIASGGNILGSFGAVPQDQLVVFKLGPGGFWRFNI